MSAVLVEEGPDAGAVWHFGEPHKEGRALEEGNAWADLSHLAIITVSGSERLKWLNDLTTQELVKWPTGSWTSALRLDAQGHIQDQLFLMDDGEKTWIHTEKYRETELLQFLERMVFMLDVHPESVTAKYKVIRTTGKTDLFGGPFKILKRSESVVESGMQVGMWALEAERVAQRRARLGFETDYKSIPNELNFLNNAVHMKKGCYPGQETVAKVFNLGQPPRRLVLLHLDGSVVELPKPGDKVLSGETEVGFVGTVARHYELGPIALAVIRRSVSPDASLLVAGISASQDNPA